MKVDIKKEWKPFSKMESANGYVMIHKDDYVRARDCVNAMVGIENPRAAIKERDALLAEREQLLAQEPTYMVLRTMEDENRLPCGTYWDEVPKGVYKKYQMEEGDKFCGQVFYAQAIPAQQVDRQTVIDVLLSVGNMSEGVIADAIIGAIGSHPSPAVAVPYICVDQLRHVVADAFNAGHEQGRKNPNQKDEGLGIAVTMREMYVSSVDQILTAQSLRITEQDAREIIGSYCEYWEETDRSDTWLDQIGRALLNKLNGDKNGQ